MALNPYQFESSGGYGLGTSTNYGGNEYGYDIGSGMLGISDPSSSNNDSNRNKNKKPNEDAASNAVKAASALANASVPASTQAQTQAQTQTQTQTQTQSAPEPQTQTQTQPTVIPQTQSQKTPDRYGSTGVSKTSPTISYKSETLPTIGYGDAGAAEAAASQAGAGSVTPEQSSQWLSQQAQEANRAAYNTPRDYSSINNANQRSQEAQTANKAAYSTPRNYSSLYASPSLPTIGYGDAGAAEAAASQAGAGKATAYIGNYDILKGMDPGKDPRSYWEQRALVEPDTWRSAWWNESDLNAPKKMIAQDIMEQNSAYNPSTKTMYDLTTGEPTSWQPTVHAQGTKDWYKQTAFGVDPLPRGGQFSLSDIPWAEMSDTSPASTTNALFNHSASIDNRYSGQTAYNAASQRRAAGSGVLAQAAQGMSGLSSQFSPVAGSGVNIGRGQSGSTWHATPSNARAANLPASQRFFEGSGEGGSSFGFKPSSLDTEAFNIFAARNAAGNNNILGRGTSVGASSGYGSGKD